MCGIAGILQPARGNFPEPFARRTLELLSHRGPDESASWQNAAGEILLLHRRLSIIDLSPQGAQPMECLGRYRIIHNGEIYNYIELRKELEVLGFRFRSQSDTEVIALAYHHWRENCLDRFDGMFAFVIWDEQEKTMFAARDRFGEKPFFYCQDGERFFFASEMKALWEAGVPRRPNLRMLFNFLSIGYTANPEDPFETFFEGISKLPPASCLTCGPGRTPKIEKYWEIENPPETVPFSFPDALEQFREIFHRSVSRRLRSDVSLGCSLSGGIDSSSILREIRSIQDGKTPLHAFTAVFSGFEKNEYEYARGAAAHVGALLHPIEVETADFEMNWEQLMYYQEEPVGSASVLPQFLVFRAAKEAGIKVLLDGQGADEILAGYHKYYKWYWQELFRRARLRRSGELQKARSLGVKEPFGWRNVVAALWPELASVVLEKQYLLRSLRHRDFHRDFVKHQSGEAYYASPACFSLNGALHFNTFTYGLEELLRYADRNAMAHGREVRLPFLSHELVEFVFRLPPEFKIREGRTKWLLRKAMEERLPDTITWRVDKTGFEPPQEKWMKQSRVEEMIRESRKKLVSHQILDKEVLNRPVVAAGAHARDNFDWRYLSAAVLFK